MARTISKTTRRQLFASAIGAAAAKVPNVITFFGNRRGTSDEEATANGYLAHEFVPTRDPLTSLRKAVVLCDV